MRHIFTQQLPVSSGRSLALMLMFTLTACGSSSMRIEVDVYRGPLSNKKPVQEAQLQGLFNSTRLALEDIDFQLQGSMCRIGCFVPDGLQENKQEYHGYPDQTACQDTGIPVRVEESELLLAPFKDPYRSQSIESATATPDLRVTEKNLLVDAHTRITRAQARIAKATTKVTELKDKLAPMDDGVDADSIKEEIKTFNGDIEAAKSVIEEARQEMQQVSASLNESDFLGTYWLSEDNYQVCPVYSRVRTQIHNLQIASPEPRNDYSQKIDTKAISGLAAGFRILASFISYQMASVEAPDERLLIDLAKTANLAAEYSNQLTARANALALQDGGLDRSMISTGQYLRDTQPTAFINLYDWLDASTDRFVPADERVRITRRLFEDDNWSRINEVYASGAGETSMAFIKDAIGNWNLKSFENDPSQLTAAYTDLGKELLEAAIAAASGGTSGVVDKAEEVNSLVATAQQVQSGQVGKNREQSAGVLIAGLDLEETRSDLAQELTNITGEFEQTMNDINGITLDNAAERLEGSAKTSFDERQARIEELENMQPAPAPADDDQQDGQQADMDSPTQAEIDAEIEALEKAQQTLVDDYKRERRAAAIAETKAAAAYIVQRYEDLINALQRVAAAQSEQED